MRRLVPALVALGLLAVSACGLLYDVDALGNGARADGGSGDAATPPEIEGGVDASGPCPSLHGSPMVDADGQCIDATEVTVADYEPFTATAKGALPLPSPCNWVTTFTPDDFETQKSAPASPVVNVNYCHALYYCKWAGKRLCGRIGGGAVAPGDAGADPHTNQWVHACTHDGRQAYSYGAVVAPAVCPNKVGPVKTRGACSGPYPGLFDMLGNVGEWIDGCVTDGVTREHDGCIAMGLEQVRDEASCFDQADLARYAVAPDLGFRCCGP